MNMKASYEHGAVVSRIQSTASSHVPDLLKAQNRQILKTTICKSVLIHYLIGQM